MRISLGNFGNAVAQPEQAAQVRGDTSVAQALGNVGQTGMKIAGDLLAEEQHTRKQLKNAQATASFATLNNADHDAYDEVSRGVAEGSIKGDEAFAAVQKRWSENQTKLTEGLDEDQKAIIQANVTRNRGALERSLRGAVIKRQESEYDSNVMVTGEQLQRQAMRDLPGTINTWNSLVDGIPHWDPTKKAAAKQQFSEGASFDFATATLEGAAQTGNIEMVRAARAKLEGPDGEMLDPAKRVSLITKAYAYENGILAAGVRDAEKLKREQEARENAAKDAYKEAQELVLNGRYISTDHVSKLTTITEGTSTAPAVRELVKSQALVAGFASLPLSQQTALIESRRAAAATKGVGVSPDQDKMTNRMESIKDAGIKAYAENPWTAAQERGVIPRAPAVQMNDLPGAQAVLAERMKQINTVEAAAERKISPLQPQEAETIGRLVQALPPDQQSSALASFGSLIGDADRIVALVKQIDVKDEVLGTAMMVGDLQTTHGRYVSELVLKGGRAIRDKSILVDEKKEVGWHGAIANEIRGAFPNKNIEDRMIKAAYYVQAGFAAEGGSTDIRRAVRMVAGRIVERNGSKFPLPRGMDEDDFDKRLKAIQPSDIASQAPDGQVYVGKTPISVEQFLKSLPDAALVHAGPGRYSVRAGTSLVTNAQRQRITIGVRR